MGKYSKVNILVLQCLIKGKCKPRNGTNGKNEKKTVRKVSKKNRVISSLFAFLRISLLRLWCNIFFLE